MDINQLKDKTREYAFGYIYGRKLLNENKSINVIENIISEAKEKNNENSFWFRRWCLFCINRKC